MHPAVILLPAALLRIACIVVAWLRFFGVSLGGGGDLLIPQLPAFALLYFAISPKPRASAKVHLTISSVAFLIGSIAVVAELLDRLEIGVGIRVSELTLLGLSFALHVAHTLWKNRDPHLGMLQYL